MKKYKIRIDSGDAIATVEVEAKNITDAKDIAWSLAVEDNISWVGMPDEMFEIVSVVEID